MNLREIRIQFRDLSGRFDLVNADGSDNGADFFINEGSRWLDRSLRFNKDEGSYLSILSIGSWYIQFPMARAIKKVFIANSDQDSRRRELEKVKLSRLLTRYLNKPPSQWTNGIPLHYSTFSGRYIPEDTTTDLTLQTFATYIGVVPITTFDVNTIILSAPVSEQLLIELVGLFYSMQLVNDTDTNFWSTMYPLTLVQSAIRHVYVVSGNSAMLKTLESGIDLVSIEKDLIEQEIAGINQMRG
jgi:hypothetical protein